MSVELLEKAAEAFRVYGFQSRYDIRKLAFRAHRAVVAACRPKMHEAAYRWLKTVHRETAARLSSARSLDDLRNIIDVEAWRKAGEKTLSPAILTTVSAGAVRTEKQAEGPLSPITHRQIEAARKITSKLITSVDNETRKAISAAIAAGVKGELSVPQIARGIRPIIGLNERQGTAVWNFKDKLMEQGLDFNTVMNRADSYASRLLTDRSTVIARTETSRAASQGVLTSYGDYNIKSVEWVADPDACSECLPNDGKTFPIEEAEGMIPVHPNCECTWVIAG